MSQRFLHGFVFVPSAVLGLVLALTPANLRAQALPSADRPDTVSAYVIGSRVHTDYGVNDWGFQVGGDLTRHYRFVEPSIDVRLLHTSGNAITENSFLPGLKAETTIFGVHPYFDFLVGYGVIHYVPVNGQDNSIVYDYGLGIDYTVTHNIRVKLDAQQQSWHIGHATPGFQPYNLGVGIAYQLPIGTRGPR